MSKLKKTIHEFIDKLKDDGYNLFPYLHTDSDNNRMLYSGPYWNGEEQVAVIEQILTGKWLSSGENVHKFERAFSKKFGTSNSLMVNSGSSANLVMIAALKKVYNWNDGDEIIVSSVGFPTTLASIVQNGLIPVFLDIEMDTLNFDLKRLHEKITWKTKAIFVSPVLGNPPDMDTLEFFKKHFNLEIILDCCDSLGSTWRGKNLSDYALASSYSFYASHHITTCEGGMVSSNNLEVIREARSFASWGRDCYCVGTANLTSCGTCGKRFDKWLDDYDGIIDHKYIFRNIGYNLKPLDLQGAIGLIQLNKFDEIHERRIVNKKRIQKLLEDNLSGIRIVNNHEKADTSWFATPIICESKRIKQDLVAFFESKNIQTRHYFSGNILLHPGYSHLGRASDYQNANKVLDLVFFIGCAPHYDDREFNYIESCLKEYASRETPASSAVIL